MPFHGPAANDMTAAEQKQADLYDALPKCGCCDKPFDEEGNFEGLCFTCYEDLGSAKAEIRDHKAEIREHETEISKRKADIKHFQGFVDKYEKVIQETRLAEIRKGSGVEDKHGREIWHMNSIRIDAETRRDRFAIVKNKDGEFVVQYIYHEDKTIPLSDLDMSKVEVM